MGLGVSAILAACKQASTSGVAIPSGIARPAIDTEPGGLQVFDWAGYGDGSYYPTKETAASVAAVPGRDRRHAEVHHCSPTTTRASPRWPPGTHFDIVHPCAYRFHDYVQLGVMQPWDTSQIPNFSQLNPALEKFGQIDGQQYFIVEDWGFIAPLYRADKVEPQEDSWSLLFDDRYAGQDLVDRHPRDAGDRRLPATGVANPWDMTDDELERRSAIPDLEEGRS